MSHTKPKKLVWYVSGGHILRGGPYATQVKAWQVMRYSDDLQKKLGRLHPADTCVWPEEAGDEREATCCEN